MKPFFTIIGIISVLSCNENYAQTTDCKIVYSYDLRGNRIKREYNCTTPANPWDPATQTSGTLISTVTPNPTAGVVVVVMSDAVPSLKVAVTDMGGVTVLEQNISQETITFPLDISAAVPGTYLVTV